MKYLRFLASLAGTFIVAPLLRLFRPDLGGIMSDFTRMIDKIDTYLDREMTKRDALMIRRKQLRDQIDGIWDQFNASADESMRAGRIKARLEEIVQ